MRAAALLRNFALAVLFLLLAGGVVLKPGQRSESAPPTPATASAATDGGVYSAG